MMGCQFVMMPSLEEGCVNRLWCHYLPLFRDTVALIESQQGTFPRIFRLARSKRSKIRDLSILGLYMFPWQPFRAFRDLILDQLTILVLILSLGKISVGQINQGLQNRAILLRFHSGSNPVTDFDHTVNER